MKYVVRNGQRWIFGDFAVSLTIHSAFFSLAFRWSDRISRDRAKREEKEIRRTNYTSLTSSMFVRVHLLRLCNKYVISS